uniref:Uncharacterized protein n=1 Tax=Anguilla anguilla TaxID=7936 RepID=A0A0E9QBV5_ANGAN
MWMAVVSQI